MKCSIVTIHEEDGSELKGFKIDDYSKESYYDIIVDEKHNIRHSDSTYYTYDNIDSLTI